MDIITPEYLTSLGFTTKSVDNKNLGWLPLYFSKDRSFYFLVDFKYSYIRITQFIDDKPKEVFEGYIQSQAEFEDIINQLK